MSESISRLTVTLEARIGQFEQGVQRAERRLEQSLAKMQRDLKRSDESFEGFGARIASITSRIPLLQAAIGGLGAGMLANIVVSSLRSVAALSDLAQQTGVSTDALQVLNSVAAQTGTRAGDLQRGVGTLSRVIGEAANGNTTAQRRFADLGISFLDAQGNARSTEAVFGDLADRISSMENPAERAAAAASLLGNQLGPRLLPALMQGRDGLARMEEQARSTGQVLSAETIEATNRAMTAFENMGASAVTLGRNLLAQLAPALEYIARQMQGLVNGPGPELRLQAIQTEAGQLAAGIANIEGRLAGGALPGGVRPALQGQLDRARRRLDELNAEAEGLNARLTGPRPASVFDAPAGQTPVVTGGATGGGRAERDLAQERLNRVLEQDMNRALQDRTRLLEQNRTPEEKYADRLTRLGDLVERFQGTANEIPIPTIEREAIAAAEEYEQALRRVQGAASELSRDMQRFSQSTVRDLVQAAIAGKDFKSVLSGILSRLASVQAERALMQLFGGGKGGFNLLTAIGGAIFGSANGNVLSGGSIVPFANGGVVSGPTVFPMATGRTGLMGEAGPEAIFPLERGRGGKLGVRAEGGGSLVINQTNNFGSDISRAEFERRAKEIERRTFSSVVEARRENGRFLA